MVYRLYAEIYKVIEAKNNDEAEKQMDDWLLLLNSDATINLFDDVIDTDIENENGESIGG